MSDSEAPHPPHEDAVPPRAEPLPYPPRVPSGEMDPVTGAVRSMSAAKTSADDVKSVKIGDGRVHYIEAHIVGVCESAKLAASAFPAEGVIAGTPVTPAPTTPPLVDTKPVPVARLASSSAQSTVMPLAMSAVAAAAAATTKHVGISTPPYALPVPADPGVALTPLGKGKRGGGGNGLKELQRIHRLLRGRYIWAILLSLVLGTSAAVGGFKSGTKTFRSTGIIRITPDLQPAMYKNLENGPMSGYESYVDGEIARLKSQRVMFMALDDARWRDVNTDTKNWTNEQKLQFARELDITRGGELIRVSSLNTEWPVAMVAVDSIIDAYERIRKENESRAGQSRRAIRETVSKRFKQQVDEKAGGIATIARRHEMQNLDTKLDFMQGQADSLQKELNEVEMSLALLERANSTPAPADLPAVTTPEQLVARYHDRYMESLLLNRSQREDDVETLRQKGYGPTMPFMKDAVASLEAAQKKVDRYFERSMKDLQEAPKPTDQGKQLELKARAADLKDQQVKLNEKLRVVALDNATLTRLRAEQASVQAKLDEATQVIDELEVESPLTSNARVSITRAERPLGPFRDTRASTAAAGALAGIAIGFGSMILIGLLKARIDRPDDVDAHAASIPMLGMVPVLPNDLADPEQAALAAHCVHEIRMRLQILGQGRANTTFAITSATAGAGKTSLTLALGLSFAAANQRTLLIDCDVVGGGLTRQADAIARRRLGAILVQDGWITKEQLEEGLQAARSSKRQLGKALVALGYVTEEVLAGAVNVQKDEALGLLDALEGNDILSSISATGIEGLYVMPLGKATVHDAAGVSIAQFRRLLDVASRYFNVIMIDTGPILGSLEASVATSQADAVVLAVAKGSPKSVVDKAIDRLAVVGTRVAGMVFNRALDRDVVAHGSHHGSSYRWRSTSSTSSTSSPLPNGAVIEHREVPEAQPYGPVARAVASWSPAVGIGSRRGRRRSAAAAAAADAA